MKFPVKIYILVILFLFSGSFVFSQTEFQIPKKPSIIYPVNDYTGILTSGQKEQLNQKLITYSDSTSTEIIVCMVNTLDGDDINYVGAKWGEAWGIGQKDKNNGILLLIAAKDRRLAIQTGRGTEDAMTDMTSSIIINQYMVPFLKQNDFYGAINSGTDQIVKVLQGKFKASPKSEDDDISGFAIAILVFFFILIFILMKNKSNHNTYYDRKGRRNDDDFWGGFGGGFGGFGGGGFGGGSSGGGFGGFGGGGSFGGGGASGSW